MRIRSWSVSIKPGQTAHTSRKKEPKTLLKQTLRKMARGLDERSESGHSAIGYIFLK